MTGGFRVAVGLHESRDAMVCRKGHHVLAFYMCDCPRIPIRGSGGWLREQYDEVFARVSERAEPVSRFTAQAWGTARSANGRWPTMHVLRSYINTCTIAQYESHE